LKGELKGKSGFFPESYVEKIKKICKPVTPPKPALLSKTPKCKFEIENSRICENKKLESIKFDAKIMQAIAIYSLNAQENSQLSFNEGDEIIIKEESDDWYFGEMGCKSGWVPKSYFKAKNHSEEINLSKKSQHEISSSKSGSQSINEMKKLFEAKKIDKLSSNDGIKTFPPMKEIPKTISLPKVLKQENTLKKDGNLNEDVFDKISTLQKAIQRSNNLMENMNGELKTKHLSDKPLKVGSAFSMTPNVKIKPFFDGTMGPRSQSTNHLNLSAMIPVNNMTVPEFDDTDSEFEDEFDKDHVTEVVNHGTDEGMVKRFGITKAFVNPKVKTINVDPFNMGVSFLSTPKTGKKPFFGGKMGPRSQSMNLLNLPTMIPVSNVSAYQHRPNEFYHEIYINTFGKQSNELEEKRMTSIMEFFHTEKSYIEDIKLVVDVSYHVFISSFLIQYFFH
jgi:hypothetical protein